MARGDVRETLARDQWTLIDGHVGTCPFIFRYREPVLGPGAVEGYHRVYRVVWAYDEEDREALPTQEQMDQMGQLEDRLCQEFETDAHAYLAAVLTLDGARQWIFYTGDVAECMRRLHEMPQEEERYPIELDAFDDPDWDYVNGLAKKVTAWLEPEA